MITDHKLDVPRLTETWLKPDYYITFNESTISNIFSISQRLGFKYNSFEV